MFTFAATDTQGEDMKTSQFVSELRRAGCAMVKHGERHDLWRSPLTGQQDWVPRHPSKELGPGLERRLRKRLLGR